MMHFCYRLSTILIAFALTHAAIAAEPTDQPTKGEENISSSDSQPPSSDVAGLVSKVSESAGNLQEAVKGFSEAMEAAGTQDAGMKALDEMLEAARNVNESLNKDSEIWSQLDGLITTWSAKRDSAIERGRTNPDLQRLAERWQEKIKKAVELRTAILDQAADSAMLVQDIENKKEVIAEYYELDAIDQVLAQMQVMSDELTSMNTSMQEILEKTVGVQENRETVTN